MSHNQTLAELQAACERLAEANAEIDKLRAELSLAQEQASQSAARCTDMQKHVENQRHRLGKLEQVTTGHANNLKERERYWHDANDTLRAELALARKVLALHEWHQNRRGDGFCLECSAKMHAPHEPDCEWRRAMGEP